MGEATAASTASPFIKEIAPITCSDDELHAILAEAECPPLLPALAYATGDMSPWNEPVHRVTANHARSSRCTARRASTSSSSTAPRSSMERPGM